MPIAADRWILTHPGISLEKTAGSDRVISISHAASPFFTSWTPGEDEASLKALVRIAGGYLQRVARLFGLPVAVDAETGHFKFREDAEPRLKLTWLSIGPYSSAGVGRFPDPRHSFWVTRRTRDGVDRSAVFLAVPSLFANDEKSAIGNGVGVRVTARVIERQNADWRVGITGASCSLGLPEILGPEGPEISVALAGFLAGTDSETGFKHIAKGKIRAAGGVEPDGEVLLEGFSVLSGTGDEAVVEVHANLPRPANRADAVAYALTGRATARATGDLVMHSVQKVPLTAHQQLQENLFEQDPSSSAGAHTIVEARANRAPEELAAFILPRTLPGLPAGPSPIPVRDHDYQQVEVRESELLDGNPAVIKQVHVPLVGRQPRSDDFAALSAYLHARLLFDRMRSYGLEPDEYFKFAKFPLIVRYRATISPGPGKDGRTVNAAVDYDPPSVEFGQGKDESQDLRKPLQVRYALGDLRRSLSCLEPLGVATDARWAWHEFGHVLLAASTGGLELPFAHSVGDTLAAIACDPLSRLVTHEGGRMRGLTFPWAHINRRHDRSVFHGWCWSGTFHRPGRFPEYKNNRMRKGYHSEQVLSSCLFRLYRSLGGDDLANDNPDTASRLRAAHYVIYLIMKAIQSLPPASAGSAEFPWQLADGLIRADCETSPETDPASPLAHRVGGWARKVIRWAFEAQGLYSASGDDIVTDAPGEPPEVDVFIENRRPASDGPYPQGGYMPVSLHWPADPLENSWLATPEAMEIRNRKLRVTVHNRGAVKADKVSVRAWYASWDQPLPPAWDPAAWKNGSATWTELDDSPTPEHGIERGSPHQFPALKKLPNKAGRYLVLAAVSCGRDESNINADAYPELPTAKHQIPIVDLVCGDNNLGLMVHQVP